MPVISVNKVVDIIFRNNLKKGLRRRGTWGLIIAFYGAVSFSRSNLSIKYILKLK
jgi:hypothetical protein